MQPLIFCVGFGGTDCRFGGERHGHGWILCHGEFEANRTIKVLIVDSIVEGTSIV